MFMRLFSHCLLVLLTAALFSGSLAAQISLTGSSATSESAVTLPDPLTPDAVNALVSRLSDSQVRELLLNELNVQAETTPQNVSDTSDLVYHATTGAAEQIVVALQRLPVLFSTQGGAFTTFFDTFGAGQILLAAGLFVLGLLIALAVEFLFRRITANWFVLPQQLETDQTLRSTVGRLLLRLFGEVSSVVVFLVVLRNFNHQIIADDLVPFFQLVGIYLIALPRIAVAFSRFLMAPDNPAYRIVHANDAVAKAGVFHTFWFMFLIGFSIAIVLFNELNGVAVGEMRLGFWLSLSIYIYLALTIWRYRDDLMDMMRGGEIVTPMEERVARAFPYFAIASIVVVWWVVNIIVSYGNFSLLQSAPHYKTLALLTFAPAMDTAIRGLVKHLGPKMTGDGEVAARAHISATRSLIRIGRVIVFGFVLSQLARIWGIDPSAIAAAGVGAQLASSAIRFLVILSIGYIVYEAVSLWLNRKLAAEYTASGYDPDNADFGGDGGGAGGSRLSTVLPLVLLVARSTIVILFVLLALGNVGVDTTPLLAAASVLGLAIGFGAQKLVTDVVSGVFFLIDDAFRTGEYITVDDTMGTVEKISVRSMQLRHHKGPVHTIPYGEIPKLTNFSRDWVIMKLKFTVPFDTDPNKIKKIFKKIGTDLIEHPDLGPDFLQPFKSQGVMEIDDIGIVMRGKFMAKPGKQFMIRKEIYNRVSAAFAENGIEFARREVRVAMPERAGGEPLTDDEKQAISAAASQAAQTPELGGAGSSDDR